jgi:hypothetical protein
MSSDDLLHITLADGGRMLAQADVHSDPDAGLVQAWLHIEPGQLPVGTRTRLVDALIDLPGLPPGARLEAAVPTGDAEILDRVRQRCTSVQLRSAGASCLLGGTLPAPAP